ncbi:hypothetical protein J6590_097635 [Homalodisca vitripennis]|nr:hypothetical protein J6590_097635 [Homalodisca vitripennis]
MKVNPMFTTTPIKTCLEGHMIRAEKLGIHSGRHGRLGAGDVTASQPDAREPYRLVLVTVTLSMNVTDII